MASENTPGGAEVDAFLADVRATYLSKPDEAVASRHLAAMAREAELVLPRQTPESNGWRRTMNRNRFLRPVATLGAATVAAVLGTTGLAVAGVDLPDPAMAALERVGITLPNQAGGGENGEHGRSGAVRDAVEATPPSDRDCAFGHRVAETAKGSALPDTAQSACGEEDGAGNAAAQSNSGSEHNQFGKDTSTAAHGLRDATPQERRDFGKSTADRAREELGGAPDGAGEQRPENPPGGVTTGPPEGTPDGPPDTAPIPEDTPAGPPDGTPGGRP